LNLKWFIFGYIHLKVSWTINLGVKITFGVKSYKSSFMLESILENKSISIDTTQRCLNQFYVSGITFDSPPMWNQTHAKLFCFSNVITFFNCYDGCCDVEARSGCETNRQTKTRVEVHLDGEEHRYWTWPNDTWLWNHSSKPLLLLAKERCLGRTQGVARE